MLVQAGDFPAGSNWVAGIGDGVSRAARVVAVLSEEYTRSIYGNAEWRVEWLSNPGGQKRKLLVARVADCACPGLLGQVVSIDLFGGTEAEARAELLRAAALTVSGGRAKSDTASPFPPSSRAVPMRMGFPGSARRLPLGQAVGGSASEFARAVCREGRGCSSGVAPADWPGGRVGLGCGGDGWVREVDAGSCFGPRPGNNRAFPDGIVWAEVNLNPDVAAVVGGVLAAFGDVALMFDAADGARRRLLAGAACLVVLDNVWQADVLRVLPLSGRSRLLVTARGRDVLFTDSTIYPLGMVDDDTARRMLAAYAGCRVEVLPRDAHRKTGHSSRSPRGPIPR